MYTPSKKYLYSLFIALCLSIVPQQSHAMDGTHQTAEEYSLLAQAGFALGTAFLGGTITWLIKQCYSKKAAKSITPISPTAFNDTEIPFDMWKKACDILPKENESYRQTPLTLDMLMQAVRRFSQYMREESVLATPEHWLGTMPAIEALISETFMPYIQKLYVRPGAEIAFHGDLHGDIHALNNFIEDLNNKGYLDGFKIIKDNFYMLFLGDYTDRGYYGAEVWYTILRLKLANPEHVFMVRGNHEDTQLNVKYGFTAELQAKFGGGDNNLFYKELYDLYNLMPVALYLGSGTAEEMNYLQCCHGGLELGFDPKYFLHAPEPFKYTMLLSPEGSLDRAPGIAQLPDEVKEILAEKLPLSTRTSDIFEKPRVVHCEESCTYEGKPSPVGNYIGFMWHDFIVDNDTVIDYCPGRGWACGKRLTHHTLQTHSSGTHKVRGVFRAHQHGERTMMQRILNHDEKGHTDDAGIGKLWTDHEKIKQSGALWDGIVCTFLVAPALYGKYGEEPFDYDAFGILKTSASFDDWRLNVTRLNQNSLPPSNYAASSSSTAARSSSSASRSPSTAARSQASFFEDIGS